MRTFTSLAVALLALSACTDDDGAPTDRLLARTTALVHYETCAALETDLEDMLIRELSASIDHIDDQRYNSGAPESADDGGGRVEGEDFSGTNNQEDGVDEADLIKTDGYNIYALNGNRLHIFGVPTFGALVPVSTTQLEGHPREMLIDKDANRAVVFSLIDVSRLPDAHPLRAVTGYTASTEDGGPGGWWWRVPQVSKITVLDTSDKAGPRLLREVYSEGQYRTARKIGSEIRVASYAALDRREMWDWYSIYDRTKSKSRTKAIVSKRIRRLGLADFVPQIYVRTPDGQLTSNSLTEASCRAFYRPTDSHARGVASLLSFDLLGGQVAWDADHVVANDPVFYASRDAIVLAETAHSSWWYSWFPRDPDQLNVHAFDISQPGKSVYVASGRVEGRLTDQFAIDEQDGAIRLATTTGLDRWWWGRGDAGDDDDRPGPESHVWVLERQGDALAQVGHLGGIAPGEQIMSARFLPDTAYLVTFERIDPLFTIDLRDRTRPVIAGELKIPGFSTYLHPLADGKLLSIGVGGDDQGANWRTTVSMFDVSNLALPSQQSVLPLEADSGWGWSEALYEHKAFQYFAPKGLLAVPQSNYEYNGYSYRYLSKLELISVDAATGLARHGTIDHTSFFSADQSYYWRNLDIRRSIFMGDFIYAFSDRAITVHRTAGLERVAAQTLPGSRDSDIYWWW